MIFFVFHYAQSARRSRNCRTPCGPGLTLTGRRRTALCPACPATGGPWSSRPSSTAGRTHNTSGVYSPVPMYPSDLPCVQVSCHFVLAPDLPLEVGVHSAEICVFLFSLSFPLKAVHTRKACACVCPPVRVSLCVCQGHKSVSNMTTF